MRYRCACWGCAPQVCMLGLCATGVHAGAVRYRCACWGWGGGAYIRLGRMGGLGFWTLSCGLDWPWQQLEGCGLAVLGFS